MAINSFVYLHYIGLVGSSTSDDVMDSKEEELKRTLECQKTE